MVNISTAGMHTFLSTRHSGFDFWMPIRVRLVVESPHPYAESSDTYQLLEFPGAASISLEFDESCRTEPSIDYVRVFRDEQHTAVWGESRYHGRDLEENWPGVRGRPPLIVPSNKCVVHFHSDSGSRDWGFRLTAKAHCVATAYPPEVPPQIGAAIGTHLKATSLKALGSIVSAWPAFITPALSLVEPLASCALESAEKTGAQHEKEGPSTPKVLVFESDHPYQHNANRKQVVEIKGAKKLLISFDPRTRTEHGCDAITFFKDESCSDCWGEHKYTGGKDSGTCNWPGIKSRPPLEIPASRFMFHWVTDSSVNDWGWRMRVTPELGELDPSGLSTPELEARIFYLGAAMYDCPARQKEAEGLESFTKACTLYLILNALLCRVSSHCPCNLSSLSFISRISFNSSATLKDRTTSTWTIQQPLTNGVAAPRTPQGWPKLFVVNARDADSAVLRREPAQNSPELCSATLSCRLLAIGESGDWLEVAIDDNNAPLSAIPPDSLKKQGKHEGLKTAWALRRYGDLLLLVPEAEAMAHLVTIDTIPDTDTESAQDDATDSSGEAPNPSFELTDHLVKGGLGSKGAFDTLPGEQQSGTMRRLWSALHDSDQVAVSRWSRLALTLILAGWPAESSSSFSMDAFGGPNSFLRLLQQVHEAAQGSQLREEHKALEVLRNNVMRVVKGGGPGSEALSRTLARYSLAQIKHAIRLREFLRPTMAVLRHVENPVHPYENDTDQYWKVCIPGAKRILVTFDPRSSTEYSCDYVRLYKGPEHTDYWGEEKYHGRANNRGGSRTWAGVAGIKPVIVSSDRFEVYFHSDGSNNDYGFKLTAHGIMEEPSREERAALADMRRSLGPPQTHLACHLLELLSKENTPVVRQVLYQPATFTTLQRYLQAGAAAEKLRVVHLLTSMVTNIQSSSPFQDTPSGTNGNKLSVAGSGSASMLPAMRRLRRCLTDQAVQQFKNELRSGRDSKSALLQALVQACISLEYCTLKGKKEAQEAREEQGERQGEAPAQRITSGESEGSPLVETAEGRTVVRLTVWLRHGVELWHVRIPHFTPALYIPIADASHISHSYPFTRRCLLLKAINQHAHRKLTGFGLAPVAFGPKYQSGDVITFELDTVKETVIVHRNQALVGLAVGPPGSGAALEIRPGSWPEVELHPAATLSCSGDAVALLPEVSDTLYLSVLDTSGPSAEDWGGSSAKPSWLASVKETLELLDAFANNELPTRFLAKEFLPMCRMKMSATVESAHPLGDQKNLHISRSFPGATALEVCFDPQTSMAPKDSITITDKWGGKRVLVGLEGGTDPVLGDQGLGIAVGDRVVRGKDWDWGEQDGGPGSFGDVVEIKAWKGKPSAGVKVRWRDLDFCGLYRWDFEGRWDIKVVGESDKSTKPVLLRGDTLELTVEPGPPALQRHESAGAWSGALEILQKGSCTIQPCPDVFKGSYTMEAWVRPEAEKAGGSQSSGTGGQLSRRIRANLSLPSQEAGSEGGIHLTSLRFDTTAAPGNEVPGGSRPQYFDLRVGEWVTSISLWTDGAVLRAAQMTTSRGRQSPLFGELVDYPGSCEMLQISAPSPKHQLCGALPMINAADYPMLAGRDAGYQDIYYCGRRLGRDAIPGSDGGCGPSNGPQCADCSAAQEQLAGRASTPGATFVRSLCPALYGTLWSLAPVSSSQLARDVYPVFWKYGRDTGQDYVDDSGELEVDLVAHPSDPSTAAVRTIFNGEMTVTAGSVAAGEWAHIAVTVDRKAFKLMVNGLKVASGDISGSEKYNSRGELLIGCKRDGDGEMTSFRGHIYDVRLWARAFSPEEILSSKNQLPVRGSDGLICSFPLTEGQPGHWSTDSGPEELQQRNRGLSEDTVVSISNFRWDKAMTPPNADTGTRWGYACTITPVYPLECLPTHPMSADAFRAFSALYRVGDSRHDLALVRYANDHAMKKGFEATQLLRCAWSDMAPPQEELVKFPLLRELLLASAEESQAASLVGNADASKASKVFLLRMALSRLRQHASGCCNCLTGMYPSPHPKVASLGVTSASHVISNQRLCDSLPYIDLCQVNRPWSAAALLSRCRGLVFRSVKDPLWQATLTATQSSGGSIDLIVSRSKAAKHIHATEVDTEGRWCVFSQAFRQMHPMHPRLFRRPDKIYNCILRGERSQDAGGPYRESWSTYCQELQSTALPLLLRTPNAKHQAGLGRDKWALNPGATTPVQLEMLCFLGKLMGHAIRSKEYLALNLCSLVWKALVGQEPGQEDLEGVDILLTKSMDGLRSIDTQGVTAETFQDVVMEVFTAITLDDREVELKPGGESEAVVWSNRHEYATLVEQHRLNESSRQAEAVKAGLAMVVPIKLLGLFTWDELEEMVCGKPVNDMGLLERVTEYSGCRKEDPHIAFFWQALKGFTTEEQALFLKFVWGRTRLPLTASQFSQRFKLQSFSRTPPDDFLPISHTCFFSLELPAYSSLEVMRSRLLYALYNCQAIDADDTDAALRAAAMGTDSW
ncbi:unnamed protein product [Chrysoparadoxa australica]